MELSIVACTEKKKAFSWETYVLLNNLRERKLSHLAKILTYSIEDDETDDLWDKMREDFPEVEIWHYRDRGEIQHLMDQYGYAPIFRPLILNIYWQNNPDMEKKAIWYIDTDVILTKDVDFSKYLNDDVVYVSNAPSYTDAKYFDSKSRLSTEGGPEFVNPIRFEEFKKRDILNECAYYCGITREIIGDTQGAAQYLLKNVNAEFWYNVFVSCATLKIHLSNINQEFMRGNSPQERENNGFQSWCADIWAVLWNVLRVGQKIENPEEFNFLWSTDRVDKWEKYSIYHNAGLGEQTKHKIKRAYENEYVECLVFNKRKLEYKLNIITPFEDIIYLNNILKDENTKTLCVYKYVEEIIKTKNNFKL